MFIKGVVDHFRGMKKGYEFNFDFYYNIDYEIISGEQIVDFFSFKIDRKAK